MLSRDLIREARLRAGLTQAELARRLGTHQSVVARWENGNREPSLRTVGDALNAAGFDLNVSITPIDADHQLLIADALERRPEERIADLLDRLELEQRLHAAVRA